MPTTYSDQYNKNANYFNPGGAITSATLTPPPDVQYQASTPVPVPPVTGFSSDIPDMQLTAPEQQATDFSTRLQDLNSRLLGESTYRSEQETAQGIPGLAKTQSDLSARLKALQNESLAIPLQIQQQAQGRGITAAGLRPHETAALRNNAIQALSVNSLLEASRGNLTTAYEMADRAVRQRFDPIREEIAAAEKNLNIILNSPAYSLAEKNRAAKQQQAQEDRKRRLDAQEEDNKAAQAMAAVATNNFPNDAEAQLAIKQALDLNPTDPAYLRKVYGLIGRYQTNPQAIESEILKLEMQREQINTARLERDLAMKKYRLDEKLTDAQIAKIAADMVGGGAGGAASLAPAQTADQVKFLRDTASRAMKLSRASGASGISKFTGNLFVGDTKFNQLRAETNSLRVNVLALMSDPNIKKFFGPQMSNADVELMTSAGTTLNPDNQSPTQMQNELVRLDNLFMRMQQAVQSGLSTTGGSAAGPVAGTDGAAHGYPGYVSDGTQWVKKK